jgi:hypothetical protein
MFSQARAPQACTTIPIIGLGIQKINRKMKNIGFDNIFRLSTPRIIYISIQNQQINPFGAPIHERRNRRNRRRRGP